MSLCLVAAGGADAASPAPSKKAALLSTMRNLKDQAVYRGAGVSRTLGFGVAAGYLATVGAAYRAANQHNFHHGNALMIASPLLAGAAATLMFAASEVRYSDSYARGKTLVANRLKLRQRKADLEFDKKVNPLGLGSHRTDR
jgi:hypothetical protein